jgi:excisionase family DNA binding protein
VPPRTLTPPPSVYLGSADVAARLNVCLDTVYRMAARRDLPAYKIGGKWLVIESEFDEWIRSRRADLRVVDENAAALSTEPLAAVASPEPPVVERDPADDWRDHIRRLVDDAPPLSADQLNSIAAIIASGGAK